MQSWISRHGQTFCHVNRVTTVHAAGVRTQGLASTACNATYNESSLDLELTHCPHNQRAGRSCVPQQAHHVGHAVSTNQRYHKSDKNSSSTETISDSDGATWRSRPQLSELFNVLYSSDSAHSRSQYLRKISTLRSFQAPLHVFHHLEYGRPVYRYSTVSTPRHIVSSSPSPLTQRRLFSTSVSRPSNNDNKHGKTRSAAVSELERFLSHPPQNPKSTTYQGTRYEHLALHHLTTRLNFNLTRVGGRNDIGVDLIGSWEIPFMPLTSSTSTADPSASSPRTSSSSSSSSSSDSTIATAATATATSTSDPSSDPKPLKLNVLIQCKSLSLKTPANPNIIRELTGTISTQYYRQKLSSLTNLNNLVQNKNDNNDNNDIDDSESSSSINNINNNNNNDNNGSNTINSTQTERSVFEYGKNSIGTLGIIICTRPATKGVRDAMTRNHEKAIMWICMQEEQEKQENQEDVVSGVDDVAAASSSSTSASTSTSTLASDSTSTTSSISKAMVTTKPNDAIGTNLDTDTDTDVDDNTAATTTSKDGRIKIPKTKIHQILWNNAASNLGLHGLSVGLKYTNTNTTNNSKTKEAILMWRGEPVDFTHV